MKRKFIIGTVLVFIIVSGLGIYFYLPQLKSNKNYSNINQNQSNEDSLKLTEALFNPETMLEEYKNNYDQSIRLAFENIKKITGLNDEDAKEYLKKMMEPIDDMSKELLSKLCSTETKMEINKIWKEVFTEDEIRELVEFFTSKVGQKFWLKYEKMRNPIIDITKSNVEEIVKKYLNSSNWKQVFTEDEIKDILNFLNSKTGHEFLFKYDKIKLNIINVSKSSIDQILQKFLNSSKRKEASDFLIQKLRDVKQAV